METGSLWALSRLGTGSSVSMIGGGLTTIGSVLLAGAPTGAIGTWSTHRLLDTLVGCAVALISTYLLWPKDREVDETIPAVSTSP